VDRTFEIRQEKEKVHRQALRHSAECIERDRDMKPPPDADRICRRETAENAPAHREHGDNQAQP
jgi:hypothetical protein